MRIVLGICSEVIIDDLFVDGNMECKENSLLLHLPKRSAMKLFLIAILLVLAVVMEFVFNKGIFAYSLASITLFSCWWWFFRAPIPKDESSCSSVSCCHYLGEKEEN